MSQPTLLYSGFDTLDYAMQGCLPFEVLEQLQMAKVQAQKVKAPVSINIGPENILVQVLQSGRNGGYTYQIHMGKVGAIYAIKDSPHPNDWNIFVNIGSAMLLQHGYYKAKEITLSELKGFGTILGMESINRVDYCFDFLIENFTLRPEQMIAPPTSTKTGYLEGRSIDDKSMFAFRGRNLDTLTVGKNPNLQVQIYNKRREALQKKKLYWFDVWNIDPQDKDKQIIRVEVRAYKDHLKKTWGLKTFQDIENSYGDDVTAALEKIRYLNDNQNYDTVNVTRATLHPLWIETQREARKALFDISSGLIAGTINKKLREQYRDENITMISAYAKRVAVEKGLNEYEIKYHLPKYIYEMVSNDIKRDPEAFLNRTQLIEKKVGFLE